MNLKVKSVDPVQRAQMCRLIWISTVYQCHKSHIYELRVIDDFPVSQTDILVSRLLFDDIIMSRQGNPIVTSDH
jgi:hypothetical protein